MNQWMVDERLCVHAEQLIQQVLVIYIKSTPERGKPRMWDTQENFGFHHHVGYGSEFDGEVINLDLCCECFDKLMKKHILPNCRISPIEG